MNAKKISLAIAGGGVILCAVYLLEDTSTIDLLQSLPNSGPLAQEQPPTESRSGRASDIDLRAAKDIGSILDLLKTTMSEGISQLEMKRLLSRDIALACKAKGSRYCMQWISQNLTGEDANYGMYIVLTTMVEIGEATDASKLVLLMPICENRTNAASAIASAIIVHDSVLALRWYSTLSESEAPAVLSAFRFGLAKKRDIGGLMNLLRTVIPATEQKAIVRSIVGMHFEEGNIHGNDEFIATLDGDLRDVAIEVMYLKGKFESVDDAASKARGAASEDARLKMFASAVDRMAARSPEKAAAESLNLVGKERTLALKATIRQWSKINPDSASAWIGAISDSALRDECIRVFVLSIQSKDIHTARESAAAIKDKGLRESLLQSLAH